MSQSAFTRPPDNIVYTSHSNCGSTADQGDQPEFGSTTERRHSRTSDRTIADVADVVKLIFQLTDKSALAACARVCQTWSEMALDALWLKLDTIIPLLQLLSPLRKVRSDTKPVKITLNFNTCEFYDTDWQRYQTYSRRVRSLSFTDAIGLNDAKTITILSYSDIQYAAALHPYGPSLVPQLEVLEWSVGSKENALSLIHFLPPTLKVLLVSLGATIPTEACKIFGALRFRLTCLERFSLKTSIPASELHAAVVAWLHTVSTLRYIQLPRYYQTETIVDALKRLPQLHSIDVTCKMYPPQTEAGMHLLSSETAFNSIRNLTWTVSISQAVLRANLQHLESLTIHDPSFGSSRDIQRLLCTVSGCLPSLKTLGINLMSRTDRSADPVSWNDLNGLMDCSQLVGFRIWHDFPIGLQPDDIKKMASAWPHLRHLQICSDPWNRDIPLNDITILREFAIHMPYLVSLEIFVRITTNLDFNGDLEPNSQFTALRTLGFGLSEVPRNATLVTGFYTASLCHSGAILTFEASPSYEEKLPKNEVERKEVWGQVKGAFDMASRTKEIQRQRRKAQYLSGICNQS